ncbi:hypothetical protein F4692_003134 [Nocardioides cavernae]|uniref:Uncharacterized protein n=1 Tax=Nocardioides cavernae TaxID=1921566 RepID=A0A7Y9H652_9ACTN|nr:hypothetical protein [Nocardioides cavernae]NYE37989.1 hypothetical protein [Nocardioides cavernae]
MNPAAVSASPVLPVAAEWLLLLTVVLGVVCTLVAFRLVSRGVMRTFGAIAVLILNFVPLLGPLAAALGLLWGYSRRNSAVQDGATA